LKKCKVVGSLSCYNCEHKNISLYMSLFGSDAYRQLLCSIKKITIHLVMLAGNCGEKLLVQCGWILPEQINVFRCHAELSWSTQVSARNTMLKNNNVSILEHIMFPIQNVNGILKIFDTSYQNWVAKPQESVYKLTERMSCPHKTVNLCGLGFNNPTGTAFRYKKKGTIICRQFLQLIVDVSPNKYLLMV